MKACLAAILPRFLPQSLPPSLAPYLALYLPLFLFAACHRDASATTSPPVLPPPSLSPQLPALQALANGVTPPDDKRLRELRELLELAFRPGAGTSRMQAMSKRSLLEAKDAFWALEQGLEHEDATVRSFCAFELGNLGMQASVLPLLKRLKYEKEDPVRVWVASALSKLKNTAGMRELITRMQRTQTQQAAGTQAIVILKELGRDPGAQPTYAQLEKALAAAAADLAAPAATDLAAPAAPTTSTAPTAGEPKDRRPSPSPRLQQRIAQQLVALVGKPLRPVDDARFVLSRAGRLPLSLLQRAMHAEERYLRQHSLEIVRMLGATAHELGTDVLPLLNDPLSRAEAARALGAMGATPAVPHLLFRLADPDPEMRAAAAGSLGLLGDRTAVAPLQSLLDDKSQPMDVRVAAAFSLAVFELRGPGWTFLNQRRQNRDYHEPTLDELMDQLETMRRRPPPAAK